MKSHPRFFNTAGPCRPEWHYTVDPLPRLDGVRELIAGHHYFVLHAPRQTGKTTYLQALAQQLNKEGEYTALQVNIQEAASGLDPREAMLIAANALVSHARFELPETEQPPSTKAFDWQHENSFRGYLESWCRENPKPIVLFIDEADSLLDDMFLALLRQLRAGFELRPTAFPQSIALVGLRDVRDYRIKVRPDSTSLGTGSPFNIKSESLFMQGFKETEVNQLLDLHESETGQLFSAQIRKEIWRLTQGQPWLTNALARQIVEKILHNDFSLPIALEHVQQAREQLIQRRDTHLDSLVDKLREPAVRKVVGAIINGNIPDFDVFNDEVNYCADLGLVTRTNPIRFANPIYQEIIPRVLSLGFQHGIPEEYSDLQWYIRDGKLDMDALLKAFQEFYRENSEAWLGRYDFREVGRQLLLIAFLQRIVNGGGRVEREMAVGNGRTDMVLEYAGERFVIELKLRYQDWDEAKGITQLARYLTRLGLQQGYLLLFETNPEVDWETRLRWDQLEQDGKKITLVGL